MDPDGIDPLVDDLVILGAGMAERGEAIVVYDPSGDPRKHLISRMSRDPIARAVDLAKLRRHSPEAAAAVERYRAEFPRGPIT